ncbi:MAG: acyltransferase [Lentisphaerae bacterium]|nr:acyltransferase [Lentisphaerota bacterium]
MSSAELQNRNCGLDLYRITAMVMITILHLNNQHFGLLEKSQSEAVFRAGWLIEYFCFAGVNCFAIISGYFLGGKSDRYDRKWFAHLAGFYGKIVLWYIVLSLVCKFILHLGYGFFRKENYPEILFSPLNGWWYISAYIGVLALLPLVNRGLKGLTGRELGKISLLLTVIFSLLPLHILYTDSLGVASGYSTIWLLVCFILGTALRENQAVFSRMKYIRCIALAVFIICSLLPAYLHLYALQENVDDYARFLNYNSPFCVIQAVALFVFFNQLKVRVAWLQKLIVWVSANSLGIYLVQTFQWIWYDLVISNPKPFYPAEELGWRMLYMLLLLILNGLLCNMLVEKLFALLRIKALAGSVCDWTVEGVRSLQSGKRNYTALVKLLLIVLLAVIVMVITWQWKKL